MAPGCLGCIYGIILLRYVGIIFQPLTGSKNTFVPLPSRKDSDTTHRRYPHGETYPAWFEIDQIAEALGTGTKLSFHLNETEEYRHFAVTFRVEIGQ